MTDEIRGALERVERLPDTRAGRPVFAVTVAGRVVRCIGDAADALQHRADRWQGRAVVVRVDARGRGVFLSHDLAALARARAGRVSASAGRADDGALFAL